MAKKRDQSLGPESTQLGKSKPVSPPEKEQSLGDQSTTGDAGSSISDLSDLSDDLDDEMPVIDLAERYTIQERIGKGGMGEVLRATDTRLDRPVAIKRVLGEMGGRPSGKRRLIKVSNYSTH